MERGKWIHEHSCLLFCQIAYKKGLAEQQTQFTSLPDPPDIEFAKKVTNQVSKVSK